MALTVAMAVHELCTNAVKYGALSVPTGQVAITWRVEHRGSERVLHLSWEESGGPPVRPPTRRGFGTRLIERQLANEFGGGVRLAFEPSGVVCRIEARLPAEDSGAGASEAPENLLFGAAE
jgi:two-component sensor histidine kinase